MKFPIIPDEDALNTCSWCGSRIDEFSEVFAVDARLRPEIDLHAYQGHCIQLDLIRHAKTLNAMVSTDGSDAKAAGKDLMFMVCSKKCGTKLKKALKEEVSLGKLLSGASL
jgi:hypothetical protein